MNDVDPIASGLAMLGIVYGLTMWAILATIDAIKKRRKRRK